MEWNRWSRCCCRPPVIAPSEVKGRVKTRERNCQVERLSRVWAETLAWSRYSHPSPSDVLASVRARAVFFPGTLLGTRARRRGTYVLVYDDGIVWRRWCGHGVRSNARSRLLSSPLLRRRRSSFAFPARSLPSRWKKSFIKREERCEVSLCVEIASVRVSRNLRGREAALRRGKNQRRRTSFFLTGLWLQQTLYA